MKFSKYQGTGNDFVMVDNRDLSFPKKNLEIIRKITDRKFGVGADGLILIEEDSETDFRMIYFNGDGSQSLCGNGSRCAVAFAKKLGIISKETRFITTDGIHQAYFKNDWVYFQLHDIQNVEASGDHFFIDNGSPHHIQFVSDVESINVFEEGSKIRNSSAYAPNGTNVNFVQLGKDQLFVRTFERGVEDETLSCGTGVTASAIAASFKGFASPIDIITRGGTLSVVFRKTKDQVFEGVYLAGPATHVFDGDIELYSL